MLELLNKKFHNKTLIDYEFFNKLEKNILKLRNESIVKDNLNFYCSNVFYDNNTKATNDVLELCGYMKNGISVIVHLIIDNPWYKIIIPYFSDKEEDYDLKILEIKNLLGNTYVIEKIKLSPSYMYFPDNYFIGCKISTSNIKKLNESISKIENWLIKTWLDSPTNNPKYKFFQKCFEDKNSDLPYASFLFWKKSILLNNYANTYQARKNQSYIGWLNIKNIKYSDTTENYKSSIIYNANYEDVEFLENEEYPNIPIGCYDIETIGSNNMPKVMTSNIAFGKIFDQFPLFNVVFSIQDFYFDLNTRSENGPLVHQYNHQEKVNDAVNIIIDNKEAIEFKENYKEKLLSDTKFLSGIQSLKYNETLTLIKTKNKIELRKRFPEYDQYIVGGQFIKLRNEILKNKIKYMMMWKELDDKKLEKYLDDYKKIFYNHINEKNLILLYYKLIGLINPLLIFQYNGYKFDNKVMFERSKDLGILKQVYENYSIINHNSNTYHLMPKFIMKELKKSGQQEKGNYFLSYKYRIDADIMDYLMNNPFLAPKYRDNGGFSLKNVCLLSNLKDETGEPVGKYDLPYLKMWECLSKGDLHEINHYCIIDCKCTLILAQSLNYNLFKMKYAQINCVSFTDSNMKADSMKVEQLILKSCISVNREPYDSRLIYSPFDEKEDINIDENEIKEDFLTYYEEKKEIFNKKKLTPDNYDYEPYTQILKKDIKYERYAKSVFGKIMGGHVECLKPGLSQGILALDYSGQYPAQYLSKNIWCDSKIPNSLIENPEGLFEITDSMDIEDCYGKRKSIIIKWENEILEVESFKAETDKGSYITWFVIAKGGILFESGMCIKMKELYNLRKDIRRRLAKTTDKMQIAVLDAQQNAIKVLMNSTYGATAMDKFSFFDPYVAGTVTWCARSLLMYGRHNFMNYQTYAIDSEKWIGEQKKRHMFTNEEIQNIKEKLTNFRKKEDSYLNKLSEFNLMIDHYFDIEVDMIYSDTDSNYFTLKLNQCIYDWFKKIWNNLPEKYDILTYGKIFLKIMKLIVVDSFSRYFTEMTLININLPYIGLGVDASLYNGFWIGCKKKYCGIKLDIEQEKLSIDYLCSLLDKMLEKERNLTVKDIKITGLQLKRRDSQPYIKKYMFLFLKKLMINNKKFHEIEKMAHDSKFLNEILNDIVTDFLIEFQDLNSLLWNFNVTKNTKQNIGLKENYKKYLEEFYEKLKEYTLIVKFDPEKQNPVAKPLGIMLGLPQSYNLSIIYVDYKLPNIKDIYTIDKYQVKLFDTEMIDNKDKKNFDKIEYISTSKEEKTKIKSKKADYSMPVCLFKYFIEDCPEKYKYMRLYTIYYQNKLVSALDSLIKDEEKLNKNKKIITASNLTVSQQTTYLKLENLLVQKNGSKYSQKLLIANAIKKYSELIEIPESMKNKQELYNLTKDELEILKRYIKDNNILSHNNKLIIIALDEFIKKL